MEAKDHSHPIRRCFWVNENNPVYVKYHDEEWGVPVHDDKKLFEMLLLESFQAGLSWECVLNKRPAFKEDFDNFEPEAIAAYDDKKIEELMEDPGIIRNRRKIESAIHNAKIFLEIQKAFGSFDNYLKQFTNGEIFREPCDRQTTSPLSDLISKDLKRRGMKFVGSVTVYAYLQAVGVINGHTEDCDWFCQEQTTDT